MNRNIVITGASGVLGSLAAKSLAERGASLALLDHGQDKLDALARALNLPDGRLFTKVVDLRNGDAVQDAAGEAAAKFGAIHALIHLVGGWTGGKTIPESDPRDFEFMLGQHVWTTYQLFKYFAPHLAATGWGRVIVVSQPLTVQPRAKSALYAAAKSAQESLTLTLAEEHRGGGLTANVIQVWSIDVKGDGKGTPPAEIVAAMNFLLSDEANKVTGARIPLY